jgi:hypothetical protein
VLKDAIRSFSLASLCLMTSWIELHFLGGKSEFYRPGTPGRIDHLSAVLLTLLLAGLLWLCVRLARAAPDRLRAFLALSGLLALSVIPLNAARIYLLPLRPMALLSGRRAFAISLVAVGLTAALVVALRWWRQALATASMFSLAIAPFGVWMLARSAMAIASGPPPRVGETGSLAGPLADAQGSQRIVWLIFDEFDYGVAFARRPPSLDLPEFDRLRRESLFAENAAPPGPRTVVSMTSLLVGQRLLSVEPETEADFTAVPDPQPAPTLSRTTTNVFRRARAGHHDTWVVGWALPYCRTWAEDLSGCECEPAFTSVLGRSQTIGGSLLDQVNAMSPFNRRRLAVEAYRNVMAAAGRRLRSSRAGLILVHLPVPHPPPIYDPRRNALTPWMTSSVPGYLGNLRLADRTLGDLRRLMEEDGAWDRTTVLVMADHPWRESRRFDGIADRRIPFILKFAGQRHGLAYAAPVDTARTSALLLAILDDRLREPTEAAQWLDRQ